MKVLYIAAECKPYSKVGGVGDVAGELPPALKAEGVDIEIITPLYEPGYSFSFNGQDETAYVCGEPKPRTFPVPVNFVRNPTYFGGKYGVPYVYSENIPCYDDALRFSFFSEACFQLIKDKEPDIVHANDWVLGFLFGRMAMERLPAKRILSIHNIGYQGSIGVDTIKGWAIEKILNDVEIGTLFHDPRREWNNINALRLGIELSHRINTVSPNYAKEITEPENAARFFEGGKGLHEITRRLYEEGKLVGILNGFEYKFEPSDDEFDRIIKRKAEMKRALSVDFQNPDAFLLGFVGRAVEQKFRLLTEEIDGKMVLEHILDTPGINVAILATGNPEYERILKDLKEDKKRKNCSITIAFDKQKADQISLGSDIFLMPSLFEPCGITQMDSLSNATPPLVRWTGGLVDTVKPHIDADGTGFGFDGSTRDEILHNLISTVIEAREFYTEKNEDFARIQRRGFDRRFFWSATAKEYIEKLYKPALNEA